MRDRIRTMVFFMALFLMAAAFARADSAATGTAKLFDEAARAYEKGDAGEAIKKYEEIAVAGVRNPVLYYNLGNAYFRAGEIGRALLYYRRAEKLAPRDVDVIENLDYARRLAIDESKISADSTIVGRLISLSNHFNLNEIALIASGFFVAAVFFLCVVIYADSPLAKKIFIRLAFLSVIIMLTFGASLASVIYDEQNTPRAIIMPDRVEVRAGPGDAFSTVYVLHEGAEVRISRTRGDWVKISFPSAGDGWVPNTMVEKI